MVENIIYLSIQGTVAILIVYLVTCILRLLKLPSTYAYFVWIIPFFRLLCSDFYEWRWSLYSRTFIDYIKEKLADISRYSHIILLIWGIGCGLLLIYSLVSYIRLRVKVHTRIHYKDNVYLADGIDTSFVLGVFNPYIYIPSYLNEKQIEYVLIHEKTHILRHDYAAKFLAFIILCVNWFNPIVWFLFIRLENDMEMSCDDNVISQISDSHRKDYAELLVNLTAGNKIISPVPLGFGKCNIKGRINNIVNKKQAGAPAYLAFFLILAIISAGLLTNPLKKTESINIEEQKVGSIIIKHFNKKTVITDREAIDDILNAVNGIKVREIGIINEIISNMGYYFDILRGVPFMGTKNGYEVSFLGGGDDKIIDVIWVYSETVTHNNAWSIKSNNDIGDIISEIYHKGIKD